jgi:autotransporter adhesin
VAYGNSASANSANTTAVGYQAVATYAGSVAIGAGAQAIADPTTAIGANSLASGNNSVALGASATATAANSVALGANSVASEPNTVSVGSAGNERRITNVAPGVNPTDAVNMSQLTAVQSNMNQVARRAYSGIAGAAALSMIPEVDAGKTFAMGVGTAGYQGYQAVAIGFSARITDNLKIKAGAAMSGAGGNSVGAGASYQW